MTTVKEQPLTGATSIKVFYAEHSVPPVVRIRDLGGRQVEIKVASLPRLGVCIGALLEATDSEQKPVHGDFSVTVGENDLTIKGLDGTWASFSKTHLAELLEEISRMVKKIIDAAHNNSSNSS